MDYDEELSAEEALELIDKYGNTLSPEEIEELLMGCLPESLIEE